MALPVAAAASAWLVLGDAAALYGVPGGDAEPGAGPARLDITVAITVGDARLTGAGSVAGPVDVTLLGASGERRGAATIADASVPWRATLRGDDDEPVAPWPGDAVRFTAQGDTLRVPVPDLTLHFDRSGDVITGTTTPDTPLEVVVGSAGGIASRPTVSDGEGKFGVIFDHGWVRGRAPVTFTLTSSAGHRTTWRRTVPYVVASMHPGDVRGSVRPLASAQVTLLSAAGEAVAGARVSADERGDFSAWLRTPSGRAVRPSEGRTVVVGDPDQTMRVELPAVTGAYDLESNLLSGRGVPAETVALVVWNPYVPGEYAEPETTVDATGRWEIDPGIAIRPATHFYVTQRLPTGDEVFYCEQIPALHAQPGSEVVQVETLWDVTASLELLRDGEPIAAAAGSANFDGRLDLALRDRGGRPVQLVPGDVISATLGDVTRRMDTVALTATLTTDDRLEGVGPPGSEVVLAAPGPVDRASLGSDGSFSFDVSALALGGAARPGETFAVYTAAGSQDHVRQRFIGPAMAATLARADLTGRGQPGASFSVRHLSPGRAAGLHHGRVGADGVLAVQLGRPVQAGDELTLAIGAVSTTLEVPAITAELDVATGVLSGSAPAQEVLAIETFVGDGTLPERDYTSSARDGGWSVDLRDRPRQPTIDVWRVPRITVRAAPDWNSTALVLPGPAVTAWRLGLPRLFAAPTP